ncbi:acyl-CoA dehydrogenase family protein [Actinomadura sp. LOL_016]|uniref:acyl-CoA dehydrogenase family protein n=1 Tax=unclassified Actinomadura TaxID=2626254 RepID=UPI003A807DA0
MEELLDSLPGQAEEADGLGRLPDETVKRLRDSGVVRMLQPTEFGGSESSPVEFFETVLEIGRRSGSAGWVSGVVGIHPFEIAQADRRVQEEIWGTDPDTWIASPYAPFGRARRVDGGYRFSGRWSFSSGTDHCDWIVLGGLIVDEAGRPAGEKPDRHFILPRADYEIIPDSWRVVGLKGTGSKDILIEDAFVPDYRIIDPRDLETGEAARQAGRGDAALYRMPFHTMFGTVITAGTLALADGALDAFVAYTRDRVTAKGVRTAGDSHQLAVLGGAAADIQASRRHFLSDVERLWDLAQAARPIPRELRAETRRNQVRAVRRSQEAVDRLMKMAGGNAMRLDNPIQRFWRDLNTAQNHQANQPEPIFVNYGLTLFGQPLPKGTRL